MVSRFAENEHRAVKLFQALLPWTETNFTKREDTEINTFRFVSLPNFTNSNMKHTLFRPRRTKLFSTSHQQIDLLPLLTQFLLNGKLQKLCPLI